jgi:DNA-binding CsgD family transcriptional regulator
MAECNIHIAIIEPSHIIFEGLSNILLKSKHFRIFRFDHPDEAGDAILKEKLDIIIVNPSFIVHGKQRFATLKKTYPQVYWLGLVYQLWETETLRLFDTSIQITDPPGTIGNIINRLTTANCNCNGSDTSGQLTDREMDVLIQLVNGLSNKEIADKLNISIHTVISHRKNITQKTGIKSQSGLTIYAISNKIISLDSISF